MIRYDAGTTNPTLLNRLGDWRDHEAWVDFVTRYDPVIRSASSRYRLDAETTEELCQRVWIDLARRMRILPLRPRARRFAVGSAGCASRGRSICCGRRRPTPCESLEDQPAASLLQDASADFDAEEGAASERPLLLRLAEEVQDGVRRRVERTDVAGFLEDRRPRTIRPRGFGSRGHLLLRRVRRPEAGAAGCSAKRGNGSWPNGGCMSQKSDGPEID